MSSSPSKAAAVQLLPGNSSDLDAVIQIMNAAFDRRYGEAWSRSQCAGILPMPGVSLFLARNGYGEPIGFSLHRTIAAESELLLLAVTPEHRRQGIGRALLDHFINHAGAAGAVRVHLEVRDGNPAIDMYRAAGFSCEGRRRKYYRGSDGSEFDGLTFSRSI